MNWHSLADFIAMGGHAQYVWGAYAVTAGALAWEALSLVQRRRSALEELRLGADGDGLPVGETEDAEPPWP